VVIVVTTGASRQSRSVEVAEVDVAGLDGVQPVIGHVESFAAYDYPVLVRPSGAC
jgi:hypothetical protein